MRLPTLIACVSVASAAACFTLALAANAAPLTATLSAPPPAESGYFKMGTATSPDRHTLTVDSRKLLLDGQPWLPVMGEFHYSRYPAEEWREELLKMKAGGIDIVATYVFWIHHEEIRGQWDWSGQRNLRQFVEAARDAGLRVIVRCGPWCHGEVRNGGLPDWVVESKEWKARTTDPKFLEITRELYRQIAAQIDGLLWKQGGPVVGIQLDNEYRGPAEYLVSLKQMARDLGMDVPLYTRTGWPDLTTPMPVGEILPLYGVYAEGFWDRELTSMPGRYWSGFQFSALRSDAAIATEMLGKRDAKDAPDTARYPYLTCEIGGGMMNAYHRRILVDPRDVLTTTLIKVASGSTLPGYYMYHGGTNPEGKRSTLMEAQDTLLTNWNDMPVKNYDFQAPLGEFGELRPHYHLLRRLHLFLDQCGSDLATMLPFLPDQRPGGRDDVTTLRWAARSDGHRGFVFVSNYERAKALPAKEGVQFALTLAGGSKLTFPSQPVAVPEGAVFWWPFNLNLGGATLTSATAQPFSHIVEGNGVRTVFFAVSPGIPAEFVFPRDEIERIETSGRVIEEPSRLVLREVPAGRGTAVRLLGKSGNVIQIVLLNEADSLAFWKGAFAGRQRAVLATGGVVFEDDALRLTAGEAEQTLAVFPGPIDVSADGKAVSGAVDGVFTRFAIPIGTKVTPVRFESVQSAGPLRDIKLGARGVATEPTDADFAGAAVWRVHVPQRLDFSRRPLLRFKYVGDVARVHLNGRFLTDDFYNGNTRDVGLWRYASALGAGELRFSVLPLQKNAPIFMATSAKPNFGDAPAVAALESVELLETPTARITARPGPEPTLPANFRTDAKYTK